MVFTLYHAIISLEIISFVLGSILPDVESVYYAFEAVKYCSANDYVCLAEYPSHYFLHGLFVSTFMEKVL